MSSPLVPSDVDLRDFAFMPLDVLRLRDSDLAATPDAEAFRCNVIAWCVAWHQLPAASLPNDDAALARLLGYGRDVKGWKRVRAADGLRGWILCDDGRLYHPVVAEKARDAWAAKQAQRARTEAARKAREEARQRQLQALSQTLPKSVTDDVTESKGQGQGQGQGQGEEEKKPRKRGASASPPPTVPVETLVAAGFDGPTAAEFIAHKARAAAPLTQRAWDDHQREALKAGFTPLQAAEKVLAKGWKGFEAKYVDGQPRNGSHPPLVGRQAAIEAHNRAVGERWLRTQEERDAVG